MKKDQAITRKRERSQSLISIPSYWGELQTKKKVVIVFKPNGLNNVEEDDDEESKTSETPSNQFSLSNVLVM